MALALLVVFDRCALNVRAFGHERYCRRRARCPELFPYTIGQRLSWSFPPMIRLLQRGHKGRKYFLGGLILVVCASIVTYLFPGLVMQPTRTRTEVLARVGGQKITTDQVLKVAAQMQQQRQYPNTIKPYLMQRITAQLSQEAEVRYEADRLGLQVSGQELRNELRTSPQFAPELFPGGKWIGQQRYEELLNENGSTVEDFERQIQFELLSRKLATVVTAAVTVSSAEIEKAYEVQNAKVKLSGRPTS
jgi:flagellar basal body-associated protein FliL